MRLFLYLCLTAALACCDSKMQFKEGDIVYLKINDTKVQILYADSINDGYSVRCPYTLKRQFVNSYEVYSKDTVAQSIKCEDVK